MKGNGKHVSVPKQVPEEHERGTENGFQCPNKCRRSMKRNGKQISVPKQVPEKHERERKTDFSAQTSAGEA
jgi:hypothetical protein